MINIIYLFVGLATGGFISLVALKRMKFFDIEKNKKTAEEMINKSKEDSREIINETKNNIENRASALRQESLKKEERLNKAETTLKNKEEMIKKREERNNETRLRAATYSEELNTLQLRIKNVEKDTLQKLTQKTGISTGEMKKKTIEKYQKELNEEGTERLIKNEEWAKENAEKIARKIIINVLQRLCSPTSVETRAINVIVPKDHVKGKIVGRNGENIKEFERLLEVDVVFNDLPNTISISAFQLVKRRVAQKAMEKLTNYRGDINKQVVQKAVQSAERETDDELYEIGKKAVEKMQIKHADKEFLRIVGRLQYRTSYGQNIMKHSMEVGWLAAMIGSELGLNVTTCKVGGFLHDLGKAIDQDPNVKDTHDQLSKEIMEKFGFSWEEVHAAWTHHDAIPQETAEAMIVKAADAISASRPGARQESFDKYIERIRLLEETGSSFEGVEGAFAISAGRELRIIVDPDIIGDERARPMAKSIAQKIEEEVTYPGQIKVNVIRKTKHTEITQ
ncbi:DUF3552 domain-containing protein [Candidatus Peregrinibacteria bacterium]|nr:DUF3552 domain-containing protein [Candidatus Peregrinibacteria bacterium]